MRLFSRKTDLSTDEALMEAIAGRNEQAFALLYDRYAPVMYRFFLRMFRRNQATAADFTQDLFLKIIEKASLFDPNRNFKTWIYVLAYNLCKNEYRRLARPQEYLHQAEAYDEDLIGRLDKQLFDEALSNTVAQLNPQHHECFVLRFQEELSVAEIAEIVGCPEGTVKSRLHHALRQVCSQMEYWKS